MPLTAIEQIIDASGIAPVIEQARPAGVRGRQLSARTLLTGMMAALDDGRPAHLTRVLQALTALPETDQYRLGVITGWKTGPHLLTCRQVEHTHRRVTAALAKDQPDGTPSLLLQQLCDQLTEASIPGQFKNASSSLAADWTDVPAWARAVPHEQAGTGTGTEAGWGHRNVGRAIEEGEMFFGYLLSAITMVAGEHGPPVPELTRRITAASPAHDPAGQLAGVLTAMPAAGVRPGDVLADSGYAHRVPATWASPLRAAGAELVQDLHPHDRGPRGTHEGSIIANGNLFCPATPAALLELIPLPPGASAAQAAAHDQQTAEMARYKLGLHAAEDAGGYRRHACPAAAGKIRCPLRPESMKLDRSRPEVLNPPEHPQACCTQHTITVPPSVTEKTRQKHDYPSAQWRASYSRRTAAERYNSSIKDPAVNTIDRGWCRVMGLPPLLLRLACLTVVRNQRILASSQERQARAAGQPPARRRRRQLASAADIPP
jgi:hypothetical protein